MLAKLSIQQQFYNWVCSKDPDEFYYYANCKTCACGLFAQEALGLTAGTPEFEQAWDDHFWSNIQPWQHPAHLSLDNIAQGNRSYNDFGADRTFGKLRERLEQQLPECVS